MTITLLDTAAASDNLGDQIIMEAVEAIIRELFPWDFCYKVATHEYMTRISRAIVRDSSLAFVGGSNLLCSNMLYRRQWKLNVWDMFSLDRAVMVGVGWRDYEPKPNRYTQLLLRSVMKRGILHCVRDAYSLERLSIIGHEVVNTSCPTMWQLTEQHCAQIPRKKAEKVVTTVNWFRGDMEADRALITLLKECYREVYWWGQAAGDERYFEGLGIEGIKRIPPYVAAYGHFLDNEDVDCVGMRLHGGIRALQKGKRTLVVVVDNRAREMSRTTGLRVVERRQLQKMQAWIFGCEETMISLPTEAIRQWKRQFQ